MRIELIRGPSNSEGSITIDVSIAILTPNVPPIPIDGVPVFLKIKDQEAQLRLTQKKILHVLWLLYGYGCSNFMTCVELFSITIDVNNE